MSTKLEGVSGRATKNITFFAPSLTYEHRRPRCLQDDNICVRLFPLSLLFKFSLLITKIAQALSILSYLRSNIAVFQQFVELVSLYGHKAYYVQKKTLRAIVRVL